MIWSVPEVIAELSRYFELQAGDLVFTGTPAGVGPLVPGDLVECRIDGVGELAFPDHGQPHLLRVVSEVHAAGQSDAERKAHAAIPLLIGYGVAGLVMVLASSRLSNQRF